MTDQDIEENIDADIDYGSVVEGKVPTRKYNYELFLSHNTKEGTNERSLVIDLKTQFEETHALGCFFDRRDMVTDPIFVMNEALNGSRIIIPICTPEYIEAFNKKRKSWPYGELAGFMQWENSEEKDRIIPVLVGITRKEFQTQGKGIMTLILKRSVEIPPEYIADKSIIPMKVKEIVQIYNDYLKQWDPTA